MLVGRSHAPGYRQTVSLDEAKPITSQRPARIDHRRTGTVPYGSASHQTTTAQERGNAVDIQAKQRTFEIAQLNSKTGLSEDFINKLATIQMRLELWLTMSSRGDPARATAIIGALRQQLAKVPSYTDYAKQELIPKVAGLVEGRGPPLETEDLINPTTEERIEELNRICEELRAMQHEGIDVSHLLELLRDSYALLRGEAFANDRIAGLQRAIEPKKKELEAVLNPA